MKAERSRSVWRKWLGRALAAVAWGGSAFGVNALAVKFGERVDIPLLIGWWALCGYFMGTMHHD